MKRFKDLYRDVIVKDLQKKYNYKNVHQIPRLQKIVVNMGVGVGDNKVINNAVNDLMLISGQKPAVIKAKKSIAGFKLRQGMNIGCKVTLRRNLMYDFLERLVLMALPHVKQFRGFFRKNFDGCGNLNFGIKEQIVFSEIDYDKIDVLRGMNVTVVTSARSDEEAQSLLGGFYLPFV